MALESNLNVASNTLSLSFEEEKLFLTGALYRQTGKHLLAVRIVD